MFYRLNKHSDGSLGRFRLSFVSLLPSAFQYVAFALPPTGNTCQNGLMPTLVRPTLPGIQTSLGMKQFFPFPLDTATAISLFQGFNAVSLIFILYLSHDLLLLYVHDSTSISNISQKYSYLETSLFKTVITDSVLHTKSSFKASRSDLPQPHFVKFMHLSFF